MAFLVCLAVQSRRLDRALGRIPLRVAVAGSRGKSSLTRLVAAGLRESGLKVLAKTTGSKAVLILPDGSERDIVRAGVSSIREQLRVVSLASRLGAEALVVELMSIGGECLAAESRGIIRPHLLVLTNVRLDHVDDMGRTRAAVAWTLSSAFPADGHVLLPEEEWDGVFEKAAERRRVNVVRIPPPKAAGGTPAERGLSYEEFEPNARLAAAALERLGVDFETASWGMRRAAPDFGSLRIWSLAPAGPDRRTWVVNAFAANDPASSAAVMELVGRTLPLEGKSVIGILNLREDRGDRTFQWVQAARTGFFAAFERIVLTGSGAPAAGRALRRIRNEAARPVEADIDPRPAELTARLARQAAHEPVIVGLGNIAGPGERIVSYWQEAGTLHGH